MRVNKHLWGYVGNNANAIPSWLVLSQLYQGHEATLQQLHNNWGQPILCAPILALKSVWNNEWRSHKKFSETHSSISQDLTKDSDVKLHRQSKKGSQLCLLVSGYTLRLCPAPLTFSILPRSCSSPGQELPAPLYKPLRLALPVLEFTIIKHPCNAMLLLLLPPLLQGALS